MSTEQAQQDMYWPIRLRDHDERVRCGDLVFYIRGVKLRNELTGVSVWDMGGLGDLVVLPLSWRGVRRLRQRGRWGVGVVRLGAVDTFQEVTPRVVHYEQLPRGDHPGERISQLVEKARRGEFV